MKNDTSIKGTVSNEPAITEIQWHILAITGAIFTAIAVVFAFFWIFWGGFSGDEDLKKAQALSPFGVALFAFVTFCTAIWRGQINTRQANQSEREGRAKLLQEGAKLLGETANPSHVGAGLATLEILITGEDTSFAISAMNLVADFIQREMGSNDSNPYRDQAFQVMQNGFQIGRIADRRVSFIDDAVEDHTSLNWKLLYGVKSLFYRKGNLEFWTSNVTALPDNIYLRSVTIDFLNVDVDQRFSECIFEHCTIRSVSHPSLIGTTSTFRACDFSGALVLIQDIIPTIVNGHNYYYEHNPPTFPPSVDATLALSYLGVKHR